MRTLIELYDTSPIRNVLATVMFTCTGCTTIAYCNGASFQRTVNGFKIR